MDNRRRKTALLMTVLLMMLGIMAGCGNTEKKEPVKADGQNQQTEQEEQVSSDSADHFFMNLQTEDLDGNTVDGTIFAENSLTMVNIWGTWCPPCVGEIPTLGQLSRDYADQGAAIVGMIYEGTAGLEEDTREQVNRILTESEADYLQLLFTQEMLDSEFMENVMAFPTTFFVDSEGNILGSAVGAREYQDWSSLIEEYLTEVSGGQ